MKFFSTAPKTRVKWHHKALTASFADATPAMIWRWNREELPAGFVLRHEGGQLHLRQSQSDGETTLAVFNDTVAAERALSLLSESLLGRFGFWRLLVYSLATLGLLTLCLIAYRQIYVYQAGSRNVAVAAPVRAPAMPAAAPTPAQPPAPAAPTPGQPVDVDSVYK